MESGTTYDGSRQDTLSPSDDENTWIPVDISYIKEFLGPDTEILNLKEFKTLHVLF